MLKLLLEIGRRRVFGTAAIYLAAAWGLIEVCSTIFPVLGLPDWTVKLTIYAAAAGFPVAVALAWLFDIGPRGIERAEQAPGLARAAEAGPPPKRSIAVLPFVNMSADPDNEYFSDGISEELLHLLAAQPGLKVAARTSAFAFKGKSDDIRSIATQLGTRNVLEGSVRRAGDRVRITAQLIEAASGYHLWSQTFDRLLEDIFAVQNDIAGAIVEALRIHLEEEEEPVAVHVAAPTKDLEAYQCYLRARYLWQRRGETAIRGAIEMYRQAIERDPAFARAHAALASALAVLHEYSGQPREPDFAQAEPIARKAMELDPSLGEPHAVLGYIHLRRWEWSGSEGQLIEALSRDPNEPLFHQWYSNLLNDLGRHDDALTEARKAYELDRVSPMANNVLAFSYTLQGRDEEALRHTAVAREFGVSGLVPEYIDYFARLRRKDYEAACQGWEGPMAKGGRDAAWVRPVVSALADRAQRASALDALAAAAASGNILPNILFLHYILLQEGDAAYDVGDTLLDDHRLIHTWLLLPEAVKLRDHPRFIALMTRMGIVDYWNAHGWPDQLVSLRTG